MRALELFSGAGGAALGLSNSGVTEIACYDSDPGVLQVLAANLRVFSVRNSSLSVNSRDLIRDPIESEFNYDIVSAGPPCQPFSLGGKRFGFRDVRSGFRSVEKTITTCRPRAFIVENVEGIVHPSFNRDLCFLICRLAGHKSLGLSDFSSRSGCINGREYWVTWNVLNSADYGLAQIRRRWILVGVRKDCNWDAFEWPTKSHSLEALAFDQLMGGYWSRHRLSRPSQMNWFSQKTLARDLNCDLLPWRTCRDVLADLPQPIRPKSLNYSFGNFIRGEVGNYRGHSGSWVDLPAKTIKAGAHGVPGGENSLRFLNGRRRYMTLLEAAVIQGFPLDYCFSGSFNNIVRMIGNACPPILVEVVAARVINVITKESKSCGWRDGIGVQNSQLKRGVGAPERGQGGVQASLFIKVNP